ncbi:Unknown protein, partial [Striga hermonthica]
SVTIACSVAKFLLSFSYAPTAEIDGFREFSGLPSDWAVVAPKPEDDFRRPPKGCFTFFVDQIMSGLRFPIQPELQSLSNLFDIPINQFTPNSIRIMVAFIVVTRIVLGNFLPEFFIYCYGYRFSKDAHCLGRRVGVTFLDDLSSNITEWKKKYFFIRPAPGQYPFSNEWITSKTKQRKLKELACFEKKKAEAARKSVAQELGGGSSSVAPSAAVETTAAKKSKVFLPSASVPSKPSDSHSRKRPRYQRDKALAPGSSKRQERKELEAAVDATAPLDGEGAGQPSPVR